MSETNAIGTRVNIRDIWQMFLWSALTGFLYRIYWVYRVNDELIRFGRSRKPGAEAWISGNPALSAFGLSVSIFGAFMLWIFVMPWGGAEAFEWTERVVGGIFGLAMVTPGIVVAERTRRRVVTAQRLAGLEQPKVLRGGRFAGILAAEAFGVPAWQFVLQHQLNQLWRHYPELHDDDLYGRLAPDAANERYAAWRRESAQRRAQERMASIENPQTIAWVTLAFAVVCVVSFFGMASQTGFWPTESEIERFGGLSRSSDGFWWRFVAANFQHAYLGHLTGNLLLWVLLAYRLERVIGHVRMLALIAVGIAGASGGALISNGDEVGVGASGVVFAAIGCAMAQDPRCRYPIGKFAWLVAAIGVALSFGPYISWGAHIGGLIAGAAVGVFIRVLWKVPRHHELTNQLRLMAIPVREDAPLAPRATLSTDQRMEHLRRQRDLGMIDDAEFRRLSSAISSPGISPHTY